MREVPESPGWEMLYEMAWIGIGALVIITLVSWLTGCGAVNHGLVPDDKLAHCRAFQWTDDGDLHVVGCPNDQEIYCRKTESGRLRCIKHDANAMECIVMTNPKGSQIQCREIRDGKDS